MLGLSHLTLRRPRSTPVRTAARRAAAALIEPVEQRMLMSAGAVDPTFGTGGTANAPVDASFLVTLAVDANGRALEGAEDTLRSGVTLATVSRVNANGTVDTTFGSNGTVTVPGEQATQVLVETDGAILVNSGPTYDGGTLTRLTSSGQIDTTFGSDGSITLGGFISTVAVGADGKIVAYDSGDGVVYRYDANGSPDMSFGPGGQVSVATLLPPGSAHMFIGEQYTNAEPLPLTIDAAGRIDLTVITQTSAKAIERYGVVRLTAAGKADASFGTNAVAVVPPGPSQTGGVTALAIAPDGTIYQSYSIGRTTTGGQTTPEQTYLFSYGTNGQAVSGGVIGGSPGADQQLLSMTIDHSDRPVLAVQVFGNVHDSLLDRFLPITPGGSPTFDTAFAASGSLDIGASYNHSFFSIFAAVADPAGNLVLLGEVGGDSIVRVLGNGPSSVTPVVATGTVIGSPGSYAGRGNTIANAFDGNLNTFYDAYAYSGDWAGQDLGTAAKPIVQISYAPRNGFAYRMVGGQFQVSSTPDFSSDVQTIYTVTSAPPVGQLTTVAVGDVGAYRYARYIGPAGGECNVAEVQFLVAGVTQKNGTVIGTAGSYLNRGNTIDDAFDGNTNTFFDGPTANGDTVGLDLGSAQTVTQVRFAPRPGFADRMVGGTIQASNAADFSTGVVTAYTITSPPPVGTLTTVALSPTLGAYRYWRYVGPANSFGNIAELEFDG